MARCRYDNLLLLLRSIKGDGAVMEVDFAPGAIAGGALAGAGAVLFYAQTLCYIKLSAADRIKLAGFVERGGLLITLGDYMAEIDDCPGGACDRDCCSGVAFDFGSQRRAWRSLGPCGWD